MLQLKEKPHDNEAWERFLRVGLPTKETEDYRYLRFKQLFTHPFTLPKTSQTSFKPQKNTLVFVNGMYSESLSQVPQPFIALPLKKAFDTYGAFLTPRLNRQLNEEKDPFALLNKAYFSEGLFLYLPPNCKFTSTLDVVHLVEADNNPLLLCPRIHFFAGKNAEAKLCILQNISSEYVWMNSVVDLVLEQNAHIDLITLSNQDSKSHDFFALRATLKKHSTFKSISVTNGGATSRQDYALHLTGESAQASLYGVWGLNKNRQHHVNVLMDHQEPGCNSMQKFKGTLTDDALSSFEGKIYVHQRAQKTEAYQMNNNLVLSQRASANSKPNLEIFADDVKASHGATVGQIDEEQLFYLKTRGVPYILARELLVNGFSQEIIDLIEANHLRDEALRILSASLL